MNPERLSILQDLSKGSQIYLEESERRPEAINLDALMRATDAGQVSSDWEVYAKKKIGENITLLKKFTYTDGKGKVNVILDLRGELSISEYNLEAGKRVLGEGYLQISSFSSPIEISVVEVSLIKNKSSENPQINGSSNLSNEFNQMHSRAHPVEEAKRDDNHEDQTGESISEDTGSSGVESLPENSENLQGDESSLSDEPKLTLDSPTEVSSHADSESSGEVISKEYVDIKLHEMESRLSQQIMAGVSSIRNDLGVDNNLLNSESEKSDSPEELIQDQSRNNQEREPEEISNEIEQAKAEEEVEIENEADNTPEVINLAVEAASKVVSEEIEKKIIEIQEDSKKQIEKISISYLVQIAKLNQEHEGRIREMIARAGALEAEKVRLEVVIEQQKQDYERKLEELRTSGVRREIINAVKSEIEIFASESDGSEVQKPHEAKKSEDEINIDKNGQPRAKDGTFLSPKDFENKRTRKENNQDTALKPEIKEKPEVKTHEYKLDNGWVIYSPKKIKNIMEVKAAAVNIINSFEPSNQDLGWIEGEFRKELKKLKKSYTKSLLHQFKLVPPITIKED